MNSLNQITHILKCKLYNNELLSKEELVHIIKLIVTEDNLQDYIKKVNFINKKNRAGSYSITNKTLSINYEQHINRNNNLILKNTNLVKNIYLLHTVFHEIYHAKQHKFIESDNNVTNLENERLLLELKISNLQISKNKEKLEQNLDIINFKELIKTIRNISKINRFYTSEKGYTSHFSERQAEYKALEYCEQILINIGNEKCLYLADHFRREKYKIILFGYKELLLRVKYPFKYFKKNQKIYDPEQNFNLSISRAAECNSLEEKMLHGFPITKKEFQMIDLEIHTQKILNPIHKVRRY